MEEQGTVIAIEHNKAIIRVEGSDGCQTCHCKEFCMISGDGSVRITADNPLGAKDGDLVTVTLSEGRKIIGTAIVFLTPLIGMFLGLFIGSSQSSPAGGVFGAIIGIAVGLGFLWLLDRWFAKRSTFRPRITSINQ
jgi:sigma-E factor negative regulatory protein RseC